MILFKEKKLWVGGGGELVTGTSSKLDENFAAILKVHKSCYLRAAVRT